MEAPVTTSGGFAFEELTPGDYLVVVLDRGRPARSLTTRVGSQTNHLDLRAAL